LLPKTHAKLFSVPANSPKNAGGNVSLSDPIGRLFQLSFLGGTLIDQREGVSFEDALDEVARNRAIDPNKLGNFIRGKGSRRSRGRKSIPAAKREICGR
jgi:hypothetical protein